MQFAGQGRVPPTTSHTFWAQIIFHPHPTLAGSFFHGWCHCSVDPAGISLPSGVPLIHCILWSSFSPHTQEKKVFARTISALLSLGQRWHKTLREELHSPSKGKEWCLIWPRSVIKGLETMHGAAHPFCFRHNGSVVNWSRTTQTLILKWYINLLISLFSYLVTDLGLPF